MRTDTQGKADRFRDVVLARLDELGMSRHEVAHQAAAEGAVRCHPVTIQRWLSDSASSGMRTISSDAVYGLLEYLDLEVRPVPVKRRRHRPRQ